MKRDTPSADPAYRREYYRKNIAERRLANKLYKRKARAAGKKDSLEWYHNNKEKAKKIRKIWASQNREHINKNVRDRAARDLNFRLRQCLSARICQSLRFHTGRRKTIKTTELLGCTRNEFRTHIESQFRDGMTWGNYGKLGWHIDHIRPCASFDLTDPEQQRLCYHYTNLQPLWAEENHSKGGRWQEAK